MLHPCNKKNMTKLCKALESDKYPQTTGQLCNNNGLCCLGVATDLYLKEKGFKWSWNKVAAGGSLDDCLWELPDKVSEWLGIKDSNPLLILEDGSEESAIRVNDEKGYDFKRIAAAFRRTYLRKEK